MSTLEQLIQQHCPNGVEFKKLGDVCFATSNIQWNKTDENYEYIDLTSVDIMTHSIISTTTIDKDTAPSRAQQIVLQDDVIFATTRPTQMRVCIIPQQYSGNICSTGYCVLRANSAVLIPKFLFFVLSMEDFKLYIEKKQTLGNYPSISNKLLKEYSIPVPPLPVQEEIVRILDILAELQAELQARKQQYEYYRDKLLSFSEIENGGGNVLWRRLGDVCKVLRGKRLTKNQLEDDKPFAVYHGGLEPLGYYDEANRTGNTTMVINVGASAGTVGFSREAFWSSDGCYCVEHSDAVVDRYIYYALCCQELSIKSKVRVAGIPTLDRPVVEDIIIPIPPLSEQQRIVDILDKFDALVNDLTSGLPAEIKMRQQQYEYYRDKLLTFKQAV